MNTSYGIPLDDERRLEVTNNETGFAFSIGGMWCNVYMHTPPVKEWYEDRDSGSVYVRYYPEFSILVSNL